MARHTFGGDLTSWTFGLGDVVTAASGISGPQALIRTDRTVTFWDAATGGNQYTNLLDSTGTATSSVTSDVTTGQIPEFQGPDGVAMMWADAGGGRTVIVATDVGPLVEQLLSRVTDLETQVADIYGQLATCLRYVLQHADGTWPVLPDAIGADVAAAWLGLYTSAQPPLDDGTHARSGSDVLLGPKV